MNSEDPDDYRKNYQDHPFNSFEVRYRNELIRDCLARFPHRRLLEVGCAEESICNHVCTFEKLTVVEPNKDFCMLLEAQIAASGSLQGDNVHIVNKFLESSIQELQHDRFDFILVSSLLHELKDPGLFLTCLKQLCSAETIIHFNVPNARSFHRLLALESGLIDSLYQKSDNQLRFQQHATFDLSSLAALLEGNGYSVLDRGSYFFKPFTHKQMASIVHHNILPLEALDGLSRMSKYLPEMGAEIFVHSTVAK